MAWPLVLFLILGSFLILMATGMPVAFCFLLVNVAGVFVFFGGTVGAEQLVLSMFTSLGTPILVAIPLFILMGEVMFLSGLAPNMLDTLDKWLGRLPGRLGLLAVGAGALFATLTGSSIGSTALLGSVLVPEMERRGYKKSMSLGPILGSGGLAIMIPPSSMAVLLGAIGEISIGRILMAIILPGFLMAFVFAVYIIFRCWLQPSLAPAYDVPPVPISKKLVATARNILPLGFIIFLVIGVVFLGVATPSEAAATGTLGTFILVASYGGLNWEVVKKAGWATLEVTVMIFMIMAGANAYGQILSFTGATLGIVELSVGLPVAPIVTIIAMQIVGLLLGMFMMPAAIIMICLPVFVPIVDALGFNPVWFGATFLLNMEVATISPPFGLCLFTMQGVAPPGTTMGDCYRAVLPFLCCDLVTMALMIAFPSIVLWLPNMMRG